jgi:hypothetical protein
MTDPTPKRGRGRPKGSRNKRTRLGKELKNLHDIRPAVGTRGQGRPRLGGTVSAPPKNDGPTLNELGLTKKRSARSKKLADISEEKSKEYVEELKEKGKAVTPENVLACQRSENKKTKKHQIAIAAFSDDGPFDVVIIDPPLPSRQHARADDRQPGARAARRCGSHGLRDRGRSPRQRHQRRKGPQ